MQRPARALAPCARRRARRRWRRASGLISSTWRRVGPLRSSASMRARYELHQPPRGHPPRRHRAGQVGDAGLLDRKRRGSLRRHARAHQGHQEATKDDDGTACWHGGPGFCPESGPAATILRSGRSRGRSCAPASRRRRTGAAAGRGGTWGRPSSRCMTSRMARVVSRPMRSASASGPIGWLRPRLDRLVDVLGAGHPLVQREDRLVDQRHQHPVDDEAGHVARRHRRLAQPLGQRAGRLVGLVGGGQAADDLHQLHHRHRVHEVHADHPIGAAGAAPRAGDADRRGVGGQDHARPGRLRSRSAKMRCLTRRHLPRPPRPRSRRRANAATIAAADGDAAARSPRARRRRACPFRPACSSWASMPARPFSASARLASTSTTSSPRCRRHLGDPAAHLTGADHADSLDGHAAIMPAARPPAAIPSPPPMHSEATPRLPPLVGQRRQQGDQHARAAGADGMAERDRAAPDVHPRRVEPQQPVVGHRHHREGLVDLPEIDLAARSSRSWRSSVRWRRRARW